MTTSRKTNDGAVGDHMVIEHWPLDKLVFYVRNPRKNDAAVDRMIASIREFGFKIPVLARSDGKVVDGHLRLKAAKKLGIHEVPVILCDEWTPAQAKAFRLMVNRSVAWAEWDEEMLALELQDLRGLDFDLSLTGFDSVELYRYLADVDAQPGLTDEDDAPELPEIPASRPGDLWMLVRHRVLEDPTKPADVEQVNEAKERIRGFAIEYEPQFLGHFSARFRPLK